MPPVQVQVSPLAQGVHVAFDFPALSHLLPFGQSLFLVQSGLTHFPLLLTT